MVEKDFGHNLLYEIFAEAYTGVTNLNFPALLVGLSIPTALLLVAFYERRTRGAISLLIRTMLAPLLAAFIALVVLYAIAAVVLGLSPLEDLDIEATAFVACGIGSLAATTLFRELRQPWRILTALPIAPFAWLFAIVFWSSVFGPFEF